MRMKTGSTLLTFTGFHDPYVEGPVDGSQQQGPILSLLCERPFAQVILFSTPSTSEVTERTLEAINKLSPEIEVTVHHLEVPDPTNYSAILSGLRRVLPEILDSCGENISIATASGTPHMHACWMLLASSGELPARLLHVRPPKFVSTTSPAVSEVDLTGPEFPEVHAEAMLDFCMAAPIEPDLSVICVEMGVVGDDPGFLKALRRAITVAPYDEPVLIQGENGTGKEIIAKLIHQMSNRSGNKLITVNCSAIPDELAESILFGHKRGSFTGAIGDEPGKFRLADGGTLFLDEVCELSEKIQAKLLRAVEYQVIEPVGEGREVEVNVRLVTATNNDLPAMVNDGKFRQDLYFRLKGTRIDIPPLRRRRGDISKLAIHFLGQFGKRYHKHWVFTPEALRNLQSHQWPGNVRELEHIVKEAAILSRSRKIKPEDLELVSSDSKSFIPDPYHGFKVEDFLKEARKKLFSRALELADGKQAEAARLLGVTDAAVSRFVNQ